jgi:histidine triad (HIT) family protein
MLSKEQEKQIKEKLLEQINQNFPEEQREQLKQEINSLNSEQLEQVLKQNKQQTEATQEIFRHIISGKIPSYKIDENEKAIAVLEINPISKAHCLIIPKEKITDENSIPKEIVDLSKQIAEKIKAKFSPKKVEVLNTTMFGEIVINLLPVYGEETINSERSSAKESELKEIQKELTSIKIIQEKKPEKVEEPKKEEPLKADKMWLPKRIP